MIGPLLHSPRYEVTNLCFDAYCAVVVGNRICDVANFIQECSPQSCLTLLTLTQQEYSSLPHWCAFLLLKLQQKCQDMNPSFAQDLVWNFHTVVEFRSITGKCLIDCLISA
jgi:hypothetical protein